MDQYIGKLLDNRYEILEIIGTGGMARVYKARCHRLNRLVAIKILREDLAQDAEFRRRFHDESQAVAMLSHPNIVAVYDVSRSSDLEYIVMELIDGITLKEYIEQEGQLKWKEAVHFTVQILRALQHAHDKGIVHRDIKPQNIMLLQDGTIKITDFGKKTNGTKLVFVGYVKEPYTVIVELDGDYMSAYSTELFPIENRTHVGRALIKGKSTVTAGLVYRDAPYNG